MTETANKSVEWEKHTLEGMEESHVPDTPFEIWPQKPRTPVPYLTALQSPRWADYDDNDTDWIPEEVKARALARGDAATNSQTFERSLQQSEEASRTAEHADNSETIRSVEPEQSLGSIPNVVLSPDPIGSWLTNDGAAPEQPSSNESTDILFSDFASIQLPNDDEVETRSYFSDSSSSDEDEPPAEISSNSTSTQKPPEQQRWHYTTPSNPTTTSSARPQMQPAELGLTKYQTTPPPTLPFPDLPTEPENQTEGPHIPPPGADVAYEQLARLHRLSSEGHYAMNAAQLMLYKRLKPVQDKAERGRHFVRADSWRWKIMAEQERAEVWGFSRLGPRWESMEGRLERERRGHHDARFVLGKVVGDLAEAERGRREAEERLEREVREAEVRRVGFEMEVGEMRRVLESSKEEMELVEFELRVKRDEVELMKRKFGERYQELVDKCKQRVAAVEKDLQESKQGVDEVEVKKLQELDQFKAWNAMLTVDKEELRDQVQELHSEHTSWLEIFGFHGAQKQRRRRSDGEIYTRTQEIESLQGRLTNCSEKLSEAWSWHSKFKNTYAALQQELITEKEDTTKLLNKNQKLITELKKAREDVEEKETRPKGLTADMQSLVIGKGQLAADLETFKEKFVKIQGAAPLETLIDLETQLQDERTAKEKLQIEIDRLRAVVHKLGHLQPQDITDLHEEHRRQLDGADKKVVELQKQNDKLKHDYQTNYANLHAELNQAREAAWHAQHANEPLLKHVEELSSEVKDLHEKLRKVEEDLGDKTDPCDAMGYDRKEGLEYLQQERLQHYQQRSELIASINELNSRVKELEMREGEDKKRIRRQEERIRGLEDDLLYANASLRSDSEPLKVVKVARKRRELGKEGQAEIQRQMNIDAVRWAEREDRWEQLFGLRTRFDEDGKLHLERGSSHPSLETVRRKTTQMERVKERRRKERMEQGESELERVTARVRMGVRKWEWH